MCNSEVTEGLEQAYAVICNLVDGMKESSEKGDYVSLETYYNAVNIKNLIFEMQRKAGGLF